MNHNLPSLSVPPASASAALTVIFRTRVSPYFSADFLDRERRAVESLPQHYHIGLVAAAGLKARLHSYLTQRKVVNFSPEQANIKLVLLSGAQTAASDLDASEWPLIQLLLQAISGAENLTPVRPLLAPSCILLRAPTLRAKAVMQYNLYCLLHALGPVPFVTAWDPKRRYARRPLAQQKVLIIGHGFIGEQLSRALLSLVEQVHVIDPLETPSEELKKTPGFFSYAHHGDVALSEITAILICAQVDERFPFKLDRHFLKQLSPEIIIINSARGELINTEDLLHFLERRPMAQAYLDVFEREPAVMQPWSALIQRQLFLSSHVAGVDCELEQRHLQWLTERLLHWSQWSEEQFKQQYQRELL